MVVGNDAFTVRRATHSNRRYWIRVSTGNQPVAQLRPKEEKVGDRKCRAGYSGASR